MASDEPFTEGAPMNTRSETNEAGTVSQRVVNEVAATTGIHPLELEPLYTRVDPDSLDSIFSGAAPTAGRCQNRISFSMAGCRVVVGANGTIEVTEDRPGSDASESSGERAPNVETGSFRSTDYQ